MSNYRENIINRCQPGFDASCSLCCGSHNYVMPPERIEDMLMDRARECSGRPIKHPEEACAEKLFRDEIQCPNVGMQSPYPGQVCCLLYTEHDRGEEIESFFNGTCKTFLCPAWYDLTDRQVLFAARLMHDWYYYSLFINAIESVHEICAMYSRPEDVPPDKLRSLKDELAERLLEEDGK